MGPPRGARLVHPQAGIFTPPGTILASSLTDEDSKVDQAPVFIGCAGWNIPKGSAHHFPGEGTHLERYARQLGAVEIDSTFSHPHQPETYARWAAQTPEGFRFAVKIPREVTHLARLMDARPLAPFVEGVRNLGGKLGPCLLQLPPSLAFNPITVEKFLDSLRARFEGNVACEPRHASWFTPEAGQMLAQFQVARVAADPAIRPEGTSPGGWAGLSYFRLHGSPRMYSSAYSQEFLEAFAGTVAAAARTTPVWCIFNNTAGAAALENALDLRNRFSSYRLSSGQA